MTTATAERTTVKTAVYNTLKSRRWISGEALEAEYGPSALRRLRDLRNDYEIKMRPDPFGGNEYRLVGPRS